MPCVKEWLLSMDNDWLMLICVLSFALVLFIEVSILLFACSVFSLFKMEIDALWFLAWKDNTELICLLLIYITVVTWHHMLPFYK